MAKKGLGKGFGSLLPENFDKSILLDKKDRILILKLAEVTSDKNQPRKHFDQLKLEELARSIKNYGILQPLVVRPEGSRYVIIAGERRFRAAGIAGLSSVPALVRTSKELENLEIGLVENIQRENLSPLEQALSIAKLNQHFNLEVSEIAKRLGKANTTVLNIVRLLKLPDEAKQALNNHKITEGHARSILALGSSPSRQKQLLDSIVKNGWSVRQAEQYVLEHKKAQTLTKKTFKKNKLVQTAQTKAFAKKVGAAVTIKPKAKGGEINIVFKDDQDLARILGLLS